VILDGLRHVESLLFCCSVTHQRHTRASSGTQIIMNYTESGAVSVGSPGSLARIHEECLNASDSSYHLLLLTEEGREVLGAFAKTTGCDWKQMQEYNKENEGSIAGWIKKNELQLHIFISGIKTAFQAL